MKHALTICILAITLAGLIGCQSGGATGRTDEDNAQAAEASRAAMNTLGLIPQTRPPFSDLPVPIGFKIVEPLSQDQLTANRRTIDHTYQGRDDKYAVERFYLIQMPLKDWELIDRKMDRGKFHIRFKNATEQCDIRLDDQSTLLGTRTTIHIKVVPANSTPTKPQG